MQKAQMEAQQAAELAGYDLGGHRSAAEAGNQQLADLAAHREGRHARNSTPI